MADKYPPNELGNVLVSLQKSFSRVSRASADVPAHSARALVVGKVAFEMSFKCEPVEDALLIKDDGGMELKLTGTIEVDIRVSTRDGPPVSADPPVDPDKSGGTETPIIIVGEPVPAGELRGEENVAT